jgi:hypothetical protein
MIFVPSAWQREPGRESRMEFIFTSALSSSSLVIGPTGTSSNDHRLSAPKTDGYNLMTRSTKSIVGVESSAPTAQLDVAAHPRG